MNRRKRKKAVQKYDSYKRLSTKQHNYINKLFQLAVKYGLNNPIEVYNKMEKIK